MARILLTGSRGFIGRYVYKALTADKQHNIIGIDIENVIPLDSFDIIVHFGGMSRRSEGSERPIECLQSNVLYTARLLQRTPPLFIFASTCEPATNVYGLSKRMAEDYIRLRALKHIILRLTNVVGKGMNPDKLLPRLARGEVAALPSGTLPFEYVRVEEVVDRVRKYCEREYRESFTTNLITGIAKTEEELRHVAAAYT